MKLEPVMVRALVAAILQVFGAFGLGLTQEQIDAIDVLILAAFPVVTLVAGYLARQRVTPVEPPHDPNLRA